MCYVFGMEFSCTCALLFDQGHHAFLSPVYATWYGYLVGANDMGLVSVRHILQRRSTPVLAPVSMPTG